MSVGKTANRQSSDPGLDLFKPIEKDEQNLIAFSTRCSYTMPLRARFESVVCEGVEEPSVTSILNELLTSLCILEMMRLRAAMLDSHVPAQDALKATAEAEPAEMVEIQDLMYAHGD